MGLVVFVGVGVSGDEDGEAFAAFEVSDVVCVLAFIRSTDIVDGLGDHLPGDGVGHSLVTEDT